MKDRILACIIILLLIAYNNAAQDAEKIKEIENYKNKLQEFVSNPKKLQILKNNKVESFDEIKRLYYKAKQIDACKLKENIVAEYEAEIKHLKQQHLTKEEYGKVVLKKDIQNRFIRFMKKNLGRNERKVFESDYIIIGKIIDKNTETVVDGMISFFKVTCEVMVENIIIGDSRVNISDIIKISFGEHWFTNKKHEYAIGEEYLFNLEFRVDLENGSNLHPITYLDDNEGFYPLIDGNVLDEANSYGLGNTIRLSILEELYANLLVKTYGGGANE